MARFDSVKFWDQDVESSFKENGFPIFDACLQIRAEVEALADWIEANKIKSYLELGVWTGKLISSLEGAFKFEKLAACDTKAATVYNFDVNLPEKTNFFHGNCLSPIFLNWRHKLGPVDLVFIDVDHTYDATMKALQANASMKSKYIALCGISDKHRGINGVISVWNEMKGEKIEIIKPHSEIGLDHSTIGIGIIKV